LEIEEARVKQQENDMDQPGLSEDSSDMIQDREEADDLSNLTIPC
jgi:hypothetical protein